MKVLLKVTCGLLVVMAIAASVLFFYLPTQRVDVTSELVMLGDLNGDRVWDSTDLEGLSDVLIRPFSNDAMTTQLVDVNRNDAVDSEDLVILERLYRSGDPYEAMKQAHADGVGFPRPRELFKYLPRTEYVSRPVFSLFHEVSRASPLSFLKDFTVTDQATPYERQLLKEVYDEGLRFSFAWEQRAAGLSEIEQSYAKSKIGVCDLLYREERYFELLLQLIGLVEDAETLTVDGQTEFLRNILYFREDLQGLLLSDEFHRFESGEGTHEGVFSQIESFLLEDLGIELELESLESPRDLTDLRNILDRAEWQKHKSLATEGQFKSLVLFAQYDRRYLRSVSRTSPKMADVQLRNHNLPMILLFREALRIKGGDKQAAVGLLDEAVRIPLGWVKSIPPALLPSSLALENFLLPGNMEDGTDKSRHWNVFGGIALYKSPEESLILSFQREIMDVREDGFTVEAVREFLRDTIANINGIYYVMSMDPDLLTPLPEPGESL